MANLYFSCFIQCHWDPAFALVELGFLFQRRAKEFVPATSQWIWTCTDSGNKHRPSTLLHPNQIHPTDPILVILVILDVKMRFVPQVRDQLWRDAVPRDHSKAGLLECFGKPSQDKWHKFQDVFFSWVWQSVKEFQFVWQETYKSSVNHLFLLCHLSGRTYLQMFFSFFFDVFWTSQAESFGRWNSACPLFRCARLRCPGLGWTATRDLSRIMSNL